MINIQDINGQWFIVEENVLLETLLENSSTLFGMSIDVILEFKRIMMAEDFGVVISVEDVKEFHARTNTKD